MLDLKLIRSNIQLLEDSLKKRNATFSLSQLLDLDQQLRATQAKSQTILASRNKLAKEIGILKSQNKNADSLLAEVIKSKDVEEQLVRESKELEEKLYNILSYLPNMVDDSVPYGVDESSNEEIRKFGDVPQFPFQPKEHYELGVDLGMMDFQKASELAGSRFVILKSDLALLERALYAFMLDLHVSKHGFKEHSVPVLLKEQAMFNTAQLPKFKEDLFKTTDDRWLISTTEIPLTNLVKDEFINQADLPMRFTGLSLCFRSEAGSGGRDTKGMLRQHQFYKVEMVSITSPEQSMMELEYITACAEEVLKQLKLPYRVVLLCSGDMGFASTKTYDIEVWLPGQNSYREISSCSNCTDFQARRMGAKIREKVDGNYRFVHTLNGSGLAVGRTLIAVMENYQLSDGSIEIPDVLQKYMHGKTKILKAL